MKILLAFCFSTLSVLTAEAQNYRDNMIHKELLPLMRTSRKMTAENYQKTKELLQKLDEDYGYETELHYKLLEWSYSFNDLTYFKQHVETLTEFHGMNSSYFSGNESFYNAIISGELKGWFEPMYLSKTAIWQKANFSKLSDVRKLRELIVREEAVSNYNIKVSSDENFTSEAAAALMKIRAEVYFSLLSELYKICRKYNTFPTGKNFALFPGDFNRLLYNNFSMTDNMERTWILLEPFVKKSYFQNDVDYSFYKSYDMSNFTHFGYQRFGLIERKDVNYIRQGEDDASSNPIPVKNAFEAEKVKKEMGWP